MSGPIFIKDDRQERSDSSLELTVRDSRTGKLRTVRGVVWSLAVEPPMPRRRLELWMRDEHRGRGLIKVVSLQDRRDGARWGERDEEEPDLELLAATWRGY